jgi:FKBP-type peptidyl-prolyl cis-trans isomerase
MNRLAIVLALTLIIGCRSKQEASIVYDSSAMQQQAAPQPPPQPEQGAPTTGAPQIAGKNGDTVITADGLRWIDKKEGKGASPTIASTITANYKGMLTDGTVFDESKAEPLTAPLSNLIPGWQEGMQTMKVGGKRRLIVPAQLGYGSQPTGKIPANSTLIFDIELLKVQ